MKTTILLLALTALPLSVLAADLTGTWKSEFDSQIGVQKYTYTFRQDGTNLAGHASSEVNDQKRETDLSEGKVVGDKVSFVETMNFQGNDVRITYDGTLSSNGNEIKFTRQVGDFATEEIVAALQPKTSIQGMFEEYLHYCRAHPMRLNLTVGTFGKRYVAGEPMPAFDLLRFRITAQIGIRGRECEDLALAIASLAFGTAQGVIAAGKRTPHAKEFHRASLRALRRLLGAFTRKKPDHPRSLGSRR